MNTLRNLKFAKSNFLNKKTITNKFNTISINKNIHDPRTNIFKFNQENNFQKKYHLEKKNMNCQFFSIQKFSFNEKVEGKQENQQIATENNETATVDIVNFQYIYDEAIEENEMKLTLKKLEDLNLIEKNKKIDNEIKSQPNLKNNMWYLAYLDVSKRFPINEKYRISNFEKQINKRIFNKLKIRENITDYESKIQYERNDLAGNITNFMKYYKKDEKSNFLKAIKTYIESLEISTAHFGDVANIKYAQELLNLRKYLIYLCNKMDFSIYSENIYIINNKSLIRLMNEIEIIVLDSLRKCSKVSLDFVEENENFLLEIINKFNILNFAEEKNFHFGQGIQLLKDESYFSENFLSSSLISILTQAISVIANKKENNLELGKYYYMLSLVNLKLKNYEKCEEYIEKCLNIHKQNKENTLNEKERGYYINQISYLEYLYIKSQTIGIFSANKKDTFLILQQASNLIDEIESKYYSEYIKNENLLFSLEKDYNFSALKLKVNLNLGILFDQYNFIIDMQQSFEKSLQINKFALKSNKCLMEKYLLASSELIEKVYNPLNLFRKIYDLSKKNFELSHYIINDSETMHKNFEIYSKKIIDYMNNSFDNFNYTSFLNPKFGQFDKYKSNQENFLLSLILYFQNKEKNFPIARIIFEYYLQIYNLQINIEQKYENLSALLIAYNMNINPSSSNSEEATKNLLHLKEFLELDEFLNEEMNNLSNFQTENENISEKVESSQSESESSDSEDEQKESKRKIEDNYFFYRKNKTICEKWIDIAISMNYNIIVNQIKSGEYEEGMRNVEILIGIISKINEKKAIGKVIEHPFLLVNLNLFAAHYHLIKNQKIYSVPYLKAVNSMITKYDWGSNLKINDYLNEMVKLVRSI